MAQDHLAQLKTILASGKALLGTSQTFKEIRKGTVKTVFVSSNAPSTVRQDLAHYSTVGGFEVIDLDIPNDELGTVCRKQFSVSLLSVKK